jgi:hypothetical protein
MRGTGVVDVITRSDREDLVPLPDRTIRCYGDQNEEPGVHGNPYGT